MSRLMLALLVGALGVSAGCAREMLEPLRGHGDDTTDEGADSDENEEEDAADAEKSRPDARVTDGGTSGPRDAGRADADSSDEGDPPADADARAPARPSDDQTTEGDVGAPAPTTAPERAPAEPEPPASSPTTDSDSDSDSDGAPADAGDRDSDESRPDGFGLPNPDDLGTRRGTADAGPANPLGGFADRIREGFERRRNQSR